MYDKYAIPISTFGQRLLIYSTIKELMGKRGQLPLTNGTDKNNTIAVESGLFFRKKGIHQRSLYNVVIVIKIMSFLVMSDLYYHLCTAHMQGCSVLNVSEFELSFSYCEQLLQSRYPEGNPIPKLEICTNTTS